MEDEVTKEAPKAKNTGKPKADPEIVKPAEPEIEMLNLESFAALQAISWQAKSRLEHHLIINKLATERTLAEWQSILKKV